MNLPQILQFACLIVICHQIVPSLIVNLHVADSNLDIPCHALLALAEDVAQSAGYDPTSVNALCTARHRVSLAAASLPVREDGPVEPIKCRVNDILDDLVEYLLLRGIHVVDLIELVCFILQLVIDVSLLLVLLKEELRLALLMIQLYVVKCILNPLND